VILILRLSGFQSEALKEGGEAAGEGGCTRSLKFSFSFFLIFFSATFDAKDTVEFFDFPSISEYTMCFWIKLDESWMGGNPISLYYRQKDTQIMIILYLESGEIKFLFQVTPQFQQGSDPQR